MGLQWIGTMSVVSLGGKGDLDVSTRIILTFLHYVSVALATNDIKGFATFMTASVGYETAMR